jgi:hypothetical protein
MNNKHEIRVGITITIRNFNAATVNPCAAVMHWMSDQLTPWSRVLLEKLIVRSASQEILHLLWNPKDHYRVHHSLPPAFILSQINPIHILQPYIPKIHFNIIRPSTLRSSEWFLPFRISNKNVLWISHFPHARYMSRLSNPPWFDYPNNISWIV